MTEERREFFEGFMAAARIFGAPGFDNEFKMPEIDIRKNTPKERALPLDEYLKIPTYIRKGKSLDI